MRQATNSSSRPPARVRPTMASSSSVTRAMPANSHQGRRADAEKDRALALRRGEARDRHADQKRVVAGQNQIDHDDLEQGAQFAGEILHLVCLRLELRRAPV